MDNTYNEKRANHMEYMEGMEILSESTVMEQVISAMNSYDYNKYTKEDVIRALKSDVCTPKDFAAYLSPAAAPYLEEMAKKAREQKKESIFGDNVYLFIAFIYCQLL